jgi:hypothetical protein
VQVNMPRIDVYKKILEQADNLVRRREVEETYQELAGPALWTVGG